MSDAPLSAVEFAALMNAAATTAVAAIASEADVVIVAVLATHPESGKVLRMVSHRPSSENMEILAQAVHKAVHQAVADVVPPTPEPPEEEDSTVH